MNLASWLLFWSSFDQVQISTHLLQYKKGLQKSQQVAPKFLCYWMGLTKFCNSPCGLIWKGLFKAGPENIWGYSSTLVVPFFLYSSAHLSVDLSGPCVFCALVMAQENAPVQKQEFWVQCGLEVNVLFLHVSTYSWPKSIHLDVFVSLSAVSIVVAFKVLVCLVLLENYVLSLMEWSLMSPSGILWGLVCFLVFANELNR